MIQIACISLPLRIPSINGIIFRGANLRQWHYTARELISGMTIDMIPTVIPVIICITAEYEEVKYTVDCDNLYVKPLIDGLKGNVITQDGFREVVEVRKRSTQTGRNWVTVIVYEVEE